MERQKLEFIEEEMKNTEQEGDLLEELRAEKSLLVTHLSELRRDIGNFEKGEKPTNLERYQSVLEKFEYDIHFKDMVAKLVRCSFI
jgi:acetyltransferase-like isoleucine patch superfamily enzyme